MLADDSKEGLIENNQDIKEPLSSKTSKMEQDEVASSSRRKPKEHRSEVTYILKTLNIIVGVVYIAFAAFFYAYGDPDSDQKKGFFLKWVMPAYIGLSGLIIVLIECRIGFMVRNLRFFYNYFGRGVFNLYAGGMPLMLVNDWEGGLSTNDILTIVAAGVMCLVGLFYIALKCCCCQKEGDKLNQRESENSQQDK